MTSAGIRIQALLGGMPLSEKPEMKGKVGQVALWYASEDTELADLSQACLNAYRKYWEAIQRADGAFAEMVNDDERWISEYVVPMELRNVEYNQSRTDLMEYIEANAPFSFGSTIFCRFLEEEVNADFMAMAH